MLARGPNHFELAVFSLLWSEHCGYKHSAPLLKRLPSAGERVLQGPGENAGVIDLGDGEAVAFKVESHNHPSAVEPFQGAATGVGGILRDIVAMAFCYGVGGLLSGRYLKPVQPVVVAFASTAIATLVWLPVGVAQAPSQTPGWKTIGSVIALGIPGTALAYLLFFALVNGPGAAYAALVTYLIPPIALAYGAIFLGERFGAAALGGLALILAGVALGTGALRFARVPRARFTGETRFPP